MSSLYSLLGNSIDYAGLFPPANLGMRSAVENYAVYVGSEHSWMLGRFVVPLSRLGEFEKETADLLPATTASRWHLSVVLGKASDREFATIETFNNDHGPSGSYGHAIIDMAEVKAGSEQEIREVVRQFGSMATYLEIPVESDPSPLIAAIASVNGRAKIRTGGVSEDAFPASRNVVRFVSACIRSGVPFKATAGLHHPVRARYRLTYEPGSPTGMMFGFLNVFLATAYIAGGMSEDDAVMVLEEQAPDAFTFDDDGVVWKGYRAGVDLLNRVRRLLMTSIGSCSFQEPVEELANLGLL